MKASCIFIFLMTFTVVGFAQPDASPANFDNIRSEFTARISLPSIGHGESLLTRCAARVDVRGNMGGIICYDSLTNPEASKQVAREVRRAARFHRLTPAMVEGRRVQVWINFSVYYEQDGERQNVRLAENHMLNAAEYGANYIAAQRYELKDVRCYQDQDYFELIRAEVSALGELESVEVTRDVVDGQCTSRIINAVRNSNFIPAQVDGKNVRSLYTEIFIMRR